MADKPLISIAIPTYNRATFLENLLSNIAPQAKELEGIVQICISNNGSSDNTQEVVVNFQKKYPGLISYHKNEKNLGVDVNLLKIMEMSEGDFVWLLGDDDMIIGNGIKKVINFIKNYRNKDTGLVILANSLYFIDNKTGKKIIYDHALEKNKTKMYEISRNDVIGECFSSSVFLSVLLFNNNFLKKVLEEEKIIIQKAKGRGFVHTFLYRLMFLKYPNLEALRFNEIIVESDLHYYKFYIEDIFQLYYISSKELDNLLLCSGYMDDYHREVIIGKKKKAKKDIIIGMGIKKAFKSFNYLSFWGCIKMFFEHATFIDALLFSFFFIIFSITPSVILRNFYKIFIKIKLKKEWQKFWLATIMKNSKMSMGSRRIVV